MVLGPSFRKFKSGGADYEHHIGLSPPSFESPKIQDWKLEKQCGEQLIGDYLIFNYDYFPTSQSCNHTTDYGHTKAKPLILCGPNSNSNPNPQGAHYDLKIIFPFFEIYNVNYTNPK